MMVAGKHEDASLAPIDARALSWFVANRGDEADAADFEAWRAADPRHDAAYARIERLWDSSALAGAARRTRPMRAGPSLAALALLLLTGAATLRLTGTILAWPADHDTYVGEIATTTLADGSTVILDSGSAIDVDMTSGRRDVRLIRGRAYVSVAQDPRPFRLLSGASEIRDIGTRFSVAREDGGELVAVEEGMVDVRASPDASAHIRLLPNQAATARDGSLSAVRGISPLQSFGWTRKRLYFSNEPLGKVVETLRHYHRGWIVLANGKAGTLPISGGLDLSDPAAATAELARLADMRVSHLPGGILILR